MDPRETSVKSEIQLSGRVRVTRCPRIRVIECEREYRFAGLIDCEYSRRFALYVIQIRPVMRVCEAVCWLVFTLTNFISNIVDNLSIYNVSVI